MRIALIVTGGLHASGREQVVPALLSLMERLAQRHEVHAFALRHLATPTTYPLLGGIVHDLGRPDGRRAQWAALKSALKATGPFDVLHGYWVDPAGVLAAAAGRWLGTPSLITCSSGEFTSIPDINYGLQRSLKGRSIVALACRLASRVHVPTCYMETLASSHGIATVRVPVGVDVLRFGLSRPAEGPPWRVMQVASLNAVKDHSTLLRAIAVARQSVDVRVDLIGEDTLNGRLQSEARDLGISEAITFHGFVPQDALSTFHEAAHLYVQSSVHEAAGLSVLEAAAAGLAIVGTRVGYVSDWDGTAAVAVPPRDATQMAAAITRLLDDRSRRRSLGDAARAFAIAHDADYTARTLIGLYGQLRVGPDRQR